MNRSLKLINYLLSLFLIFWLLSGKLNTEKYQETIDKYPSFFTTSTLLFQALIISIILAFKWRDPKLECSREVAICSVLYTMSQIGFDYPKLPFVSRVIMYILPIVLTLDIASFNIISIALSMTAIILVRNLEGDSIDIVSVTLASVVRGVLYRSFRRNRLRNPLDFIFSIFLLSSGFSILGLFAEGIYTKTFIVHYVNFPSYILSMSVDNYISLGIKIITDFLTITITYHLIVHEGLGKVAYLYAWVYLLLVSAAIYIEYENVVSTFILLPISSLLLIIQYLIDKIQCQRNNSEDYMYSLI